MTEAEELGTELADFRQRVEELHLARGLPRAEQLPALDAALIELQHAVEALWPRYERLASAQQGGGRRGDGPEQQLLRALFQRLPVPTMLLDRDTVVRRLNVAATHLFGMRAGYATGRSLAASLARDGRAAFRSQVAAVARGEGERSLVVHPLRPPELSATQDGGALRVTLTALRPPQEPRAAVLAVFQGAAAAPPASGEPGAEQRLGPPPDPDDVSRRTDALDLVDAMAATLLASGPDATREAVVAAAAELLHQRYADWVIVDLVAAEEPAAAESQPAAALAAPPGGGHDLGIRAPAGGDGGPEGFPDTLGTLRRIWVSGADAELRKLLTAQPPWESPLVSDAVRHGAEALQVRPDDPAGLGRDPTGAPLLVRAEVSSLVCVPLSGGSAGPGGPATADSQRILGALTLLRTGARRPFGLTEASAVDRVARHLALALVHRA